jgi:CSLREA domain-containing protein
MSASVLASVLLLGGTIASPPGAVASEPIRVTTHADAIAGDGKCSLREAVLAADTDRSVDACPSGHGADVIRLFEGTYRLERRGSNEDAGRTGDLDVTADLAIRGGSASRTVIDAAGLDDRVIDVLGTARLELSSLTVRHGGLYEHGHGRSAGGGIASTGTLVLRHVAVIDNWASGDGGGIASSGSLTMVDCRVAWNTAGPNLGGGGIWTSGSASVAHSVIEDNRTSGEGAAGIAATGPLDLSRSIVRRNVGSGEWPPGGVSMRGGQIRDTTIAGNRAGGLGTGGVVLRDHAALVRSTVSGNVGGAEGGAGGVLVVDSEITNSTISGNSGGSSMDNGMTTPTAGGVFSIGSRIRASTIADNTSTAQDGAPAGGLYADTGTHLRGTIVAGNRGPARGGQDCAGTLASDGFVLIATTAGCTIMSRSSDILGRDPRLGPLADHGGPTRTHALGAGSPAIDAWPVVQGTKRTGCPAIDQRGVRRPAIGGHHDRVRCDIGSVEMTGH